MRQQTQPPRPSWLASVLVALRRYILLVPEFILLLILLILHASLGSPPLTAFLGLLLIAWFALRLGLLIAARRASAQAAYKHAETALCVAGWMNPFSADLYMLRGMLALARGKADQAVTALRQASALYPHHASLHAALAGAFLDAGHPNDAHRESRHALVLDPACARAYLHLANAAQDLAAAPALVEQHLRAGLRACRNADDEVALRCALAALLLSTDREPEARLMLAGTESLLGHCTAPHRASIHFYLGELLRLLGEVDQARRHFSASEALDPHGRHAAAAWRAARS